ncbi:VWA domain-containing protein (plasmid) [Halobaculum magnesiiphilum]|uniref:VWA domain-containing protein n=1 Tax=Halobaculum magnesiiphilum TaxID=1017351 RepID=A0A8T8WJ09_9EURY|nr:VWA domain-containing protein [Halobaculum magnesiiphilum]
MPDDDGGFDGTDADRVDEGPEFGSGDTPAFRAARDHVREELVRFVRALRRAGVAVPANAGTTAARALVEVGFDDEGTARAALRACLVSDPESIETFDRQFREFWRRLTAGLNPAGPAPRTAAEDGPEGALAPMGEGAPAEDPDADATGAAADTAGDVDPDPSAVARASLGATVSGADGDDDDDAERVDRAWYSPTGSPDPVSGAVDAEPEVGEAVAELTRGLESLRGRRWRPGDERVDVRRSLRTSVGTGGTVVSLPKRERVPNDVRAVWLVDVSRSVLDTVDRSVLLATLRRAKAEWRHCRIVFFDETAREVSAAFDEPTPGAALAALERAETEWGGGTRIGASIGEILETAPEAFDRRTVVFVVSDGLEMGDADELSRVLATLSRRTAGIVWLNPLAASSTYEPTARGMSRARPFVDGLFAFGTAADLVEVGRQLRRHGLGGRIGYEYDPRRGVGRARRDTA